MPAINLYDLVVWIFLLHITPMRIHLLFAFLVGSSCLSATATARDRVFFNGKVWTGPGQTAEAVLVSNERIVAVGTTGDILRIAPINAERIDVGGRIVLPGFIDSHVHFFWGALSLASVDLRDANSPAEFSRRITTRAAERPGEWILYGNWDHERWGGALPDRKWIDAKTGDTPVYVQRSDGHMALANSAALKLAGIDASTVDPIGGKILRDASGEPTGIIKDTAMTLVERVVPPFSDERMDEALQIATDLALSKGLTRIQDMSEGNLTSFTTFRRNHRAGKLRIRIQAFVPLADRAKLQSLENAGTDDDWLRLNGVKAFVDGSLGSSTAWFQEPYTDAPTNYGLTVTDLDELANGMKAANVDGQQLAIHAIGDEANRWTLDHLATLQRSRMPARIEHAQHLNFSDIARFSKLGVVASMQPYHAIDDGRWAELRIGPKRLKGTYAFHSLLEVGAIIAFGSDWPVAPLDPLTGIAAAVNRQTLDGLHPDGWQPQEKIGVEQAVRAYTEGAAYAGGVSDRAGRIAPGYLADMVILSHDIFSIAPDCIDRIRVLRTVVGGEDRFIALPAPADAASYGNDDCGPHHAR